VARDASHPRGWHVHQVERRTTAPLTSSARDEPDLAEDILFGARALALESRWAEHLLSCWEAGETSLRRPLDQA
jgi:hypothetical protein